MSYAALLRLDVTIRPITTEIPGNAGYGYWRGSPFRAPISATMELLERELRLLDGKRVAIELGFHESELRLDGLPRANANAWTPAVRLAFDSKWGPLQYATNEYGSWQDNLRAIALSMEALRKVDRYGVSKRGEQYQGWRAIPVSTDPAEAIHTREQAHAVLDAFGGDLRRALFETHPDRGGDEAEFRKVIRAKELLEA